MEFSTVLLILNNNIDSKNEIGKWDKNMVKHFIISA